VAREVSDWVTGSLGTEMPPLPPCIIRRVERDGANQVGMWLCKCSAWGQVFSLQYVW